MTATEKVAQAEERAAKANLHAERLRRVAQAEAEIPGIWDTGQVTMNKLADTYAISQATVKRILRDSGRQSTRFRKIGDAERAEIANLLGQGVNHGEIASTYQIAKTSVRRIGLETGILRPGRRMPRRSAEDYANIRAFDEECRQRFNGAGLYNLGLGLRAYDRKNAARDAVNSQMAASPTTPVQPEQPEQPEQAIQQWEPNEALIDPRNALAEPTPDFVGDQHGTTQYDPAPQVERLPQEHAPWAPIPAPVNPDPDDDVSF